MKIKAKRKRSVARRRHVNGRGALKVNTDESFAAAMPVVGSPANAYKFTAEKRRVVLGQMLEGHTVEAAARAAGVTRTTVLLARRADAEFREQFEAAREVGAEIIDDELWAGARGIKKINFHAVIAVLNARKPQMYRQNFKVEHAGSVAVTSDALAMARERFAGRGASDGERAH